MGKPRISGLLSTLETLPRADQEAAYAHLGSLLSPGGASAHPERNQAAGGDEHEWLLDGVRAELARRGIPWVVRADKLREQPEYRGTEKRQGFAQHAAVVGPWLGGLVLNADRTQLLALSRTAAECLAQYIGKFTEVGLRQMLWNYNYVPDAIEQEFPEYVRNGWCAALVKEAEN